MDVMEAIRTRRSIRKYRDEPIPDKILEQILEAARFAPSWANTQCWRFIVVKDIAMKEALKETLSPNNPATKAMTQAPVLIVSCALKKVAGHHKGTPVTSKGDAWYMYDVALANQNLMLAAHSLGLGTVQVGSFDADKAERVLDVPDDMTVVTMTPLGYPAAEGRETPRKELSEIVSNERYGE